MPKSSPVLSKCFFYNLTVAPQVFARKLQSMPTLPYGTQNSLAIVLKFTRRKFQLHPVHQDHLPLVVHIQSPNETPNRQQQGTCYFHASAPSTGNYHANGGESNSGICTGTHAPKG
mmetsp:Transcript_53110/g.119212  ORF Transcript_53110/g.119212 Transcript_53110/m.119212 type:complete len:116 (+) Transcript_53110:349-696(+)